MSLLGTLGAPAVPLQCNNAMHLESYMRLRRTIESHALPARYHLGADTVARGRAQVGVHSAKSDWSRRILDFAYMDYDDQAAHHE